MSTTVQAAPVTTWTIDPTHSHVEFAVRHLMITTVKGRFADVQGTVRIDEADLSKSQAEHYDWRRQHRYARAAA